MTKTRIRRYKKEDVLPFYEAVSESKVELSKWFQWCHDDYSLNDAREWVTVMVPDIWQAKTGCEFVVEDVKTKKIVGGCCLEQLNLEQKEAGVGYWIKTTEAGKGRATAAALQIIDFGFSTLGLERIHVIPSVENIPSQKVAQKLPL